MLHILYLEYDVSRSSALLSGRNSELTVKFFFSFLANFENTGIRVCIQNGPRKIHEGWQMAGGGKKRGLR